MPFTPEARRAYEQTRRKGGIRERTMESAHRARTQQRADHILTFVAVDGEGVDRPDGTHDYNLLTVGDQSLYHPDGSRLTTDNILSFLWEAHEPQAVHVGYFLGYDFAQWLRDLPEERARMLLTPEGRAARVRRNRIGGAAPFPVRWGRWEFDLLPNLKRFKLRPRGVHKASWLWVCDTGGLYQTSFVKAIDPATWPEPICTPAEFDQIKAGKAARSDNLVNYGTPIDRATLAYNRLENEILSRLMTATNKGLTAMGVRLKRPQWHGPGQAAQAWLKATASTHDGDSCRAVAPEEPFAAAQASYFGGWFEITAHGPIPGVTWEYDINSAYPSIIARLPCLLHGRWSHGHGTPPESHYVLVNGSVRGSDPFLGTMPHRIYTGAVRRPWWSRGWMWAHEVKAAQQAGLVDHLDVSEWWSYTPCDCPPPFADIARLYRQRLAVGKNSPQGRGLKLVYNSTYGKMAQSAGHPLFGNSVYASLITAGCRTMILDAIASHPERSKAVVMIATDGVYFTSPHPGLELDPTKLGAWDEGTKTNLSLFKPGVYWDDKTREAVRTGGSLGLKSRGISETALAKVIDQIDDQWSSFTPVSDPEAWPALNVPIPFSVIGPKLALHRNKWHLCGTVQHDLSPKQSSWVMPKRGGIIPDNDELFIRSRPHRNLDRIPSIPYDKHFGLELKEDASLLPTLPEGIVTELLAEVLGVG